MFDPFVLYIVMILIMTGFRYDRSSEHVLNVRAVGGVMSPR